MIRVTDIKKGENKMNNKRDAMGDRFKEYEAVSNNSDIIVDVNEKTGEIINFNIAVSVE